MTDLPDITLILGPQCRAALALNACLRGNAKQLGEKGITIVPSRLASPLLRRALDDRSEKERVEEFEARTNRRPVILSAINMFGPPHAGLAKGELFPDAEVTLAGLAQIAGKARVVIGIDPLPEFFLASRSDELEERVRRTPWEVLYELSWFDLIQEIVHLLPDCELLVASTDAIGKTQRATLSRLLGPVADELPETKGLLPHLISDTGHAVFDRVVERGTPDEATLTDLYTSFALRPGLADVKERLGIDKVTNTLLNQRFAEDMERIAALDQVEVL